jgi:hypothetical protein
LTVYPSKIKLPYRVSRRWREERILAGDLQGPIRQVEIDLDRLDPERRDRALAVWKRVRVHETTDGLEVIGSGLFSADLAERVPAEDPDDDIPFDDPPAAADPVIAKIGRMPELPAPASTGFDVIEAYEPWLGRYVDLSVGALAAFIDKHAPVTDNEEAVKAARVKPDVWRWEIGFRVNDGPVRECVIDGRTDLELLRRCRAAYQRIAAANVGDEMRVTIVARQVVGFDVELDHKPKSKDELVGAYEDHCDRLAEVTLAYKWTTQREKLGFDVEMRRWAFESGSDRLQMGIEDGYRMIPVYLTERIAAEAPGFYAYARENRDGVSWQTRTGPTEPALRWRRVIQEALDSHCPPGMPSAKAEIVWMKTPPIEMCDDGLAWERDYDGDPVHRLEVPFEAIAVPNWLGRYTLLAGVISDEYTVPDYLQLQHVLHPDDYDVDGLPAPPARTGCLGRLQIPIDASDFRPSAGSGAADDDIPF